MREITPTLGLRVTETVKPESKLGIQIGEPVGHSRPPRVYLASTEFPNAGITTVITKIMEAGGIAEAWEIPESDAPSMGEKSADKTAECAQDFLDGFNPDDGGTLFFAGSEELADDVLNRVDVPDNIDIKINEGEPEYVPDPTN